MGSPYLLAHRLGWSAYIAGKRESRRLIGDEFISTFTCGMMGEIVGKAATISLRHGTDPRGVYEKHLPEIKALLERPGNALQ